MLNNCSGLHWGNSLVVQRQGHAIGSVVVRAMARVLVWSLATAGQFFEGMICSLGTLPCHCWRLNSATLAAILVGALMQLWEQSHLWIMQVITFAAGSGDGVCIENTSHFSLITINHDQYPHNNPKNHHRSSTRFRIDGANAWRASIRKALASPLCQLVWKFKLQLFAIARITSILISAREKRRVTQDATSKYFGFVYRFSDYG